MEYMNSSNEKPPVSKNPESSILGPLKGGAIVVDRFNSHIHDGPVAKLIPEALQHIDPAGRSFIVAEVDLGRPVGESICVSTSENDEIIFAQRRGRAGLTRFVKNKAPAPSSLMTVILKRTEAAPKAQYVLITGYIGPNAGPEPWDAYATEESHSFWSTHALAWGSAPIVPGTEQTEVPPEFQ